MKKQIIEVLSHIDVRGKELLYLKLTIGETPVLINIGQKTFDSVLDAINNEKNQTPQGGIPTNGKI